MSVPPPSLADALAHTTQRLIAAGIPSARTESEWLLCHILSCSRTDLLVNTHRTLSSEHARILKAALVKRTARIPLQHILGETEFFSLPFYVSPAALIPRPETEILVETLANRLQSISNPYILDLCTGAGPIAVALAHTLPTAHLIATDLSQDALLLAQKNARHNLVHTRTAFLQANLLTPFATRPTFHAIAANPPYIPSSDLSTLQIEVRDHEPHLALDGGPDGLTTSRHMPGPRAA